MKSYMERIAGVGARKQLIFDQKRKELRSEVDNGVYNACRQREFYRLQADEAIQRARSAQARGDQAGLRLAKQQLTMTYGFYHFCGVLYDSLRAVQGQLDMQEMTRDFQSVVKHLTQIRVKDTAVDFSQLIQQVTKAFKPVSVTGLEDMMETLLRGTITADDAAKMDNAFIDQLVAGEVSLDSAYISDTLKTFDETQTIPADCPTGTSDLLRQLEELNRNT